MTSVDHIYMILVMVKRRRRASATSMPEHANKICRSSTTLKFCTALFSLDLYVGLEVEVLVYFLIEDLPSLSRVVLLTCTKLALTAIDNGEVRG